MIVRERVALIDRCYDAAGHHVVQTTLGERLASRRGRQGRARNSGATRGARTTFGPIRHKCGCTVPQ